MPLYHYTIIPLKVYHENNIVYTFETSCMFDHDDRDVSYFVINREFSKAWPYYFTPRATVTLCQSVLQAVTMTTL